MLVKIFDGLKTTFNEMEMKKKIMLGIGILFLFVIIIASSCKKTDKITTKLDDYKNIKTLITEAAKKYFKAEDLLPEINYEEEVEIKELVKEKYMKELSSYLSEGKTCDGSVLVRNVENKYYYNPILDCGEDYYDLTLPEAVLLDNEIVTSGIGLYSDGKVKYFKGEVTNNYVKIGKYLWRIISVNENNDVQLVIHEIDSKNKVLNKRYIWDNRYNNEKKEYRGKNDFNISRIKDTLTLLANDDSIIDPANRGMLIKRNLCVGPRLLSDFTNDNSQECAKKSDELYFFGTITVSDYLRASLDPDCKTIISPTCGNYNYLVNNNQNGWTITPSAENTYEVYNYLLSGLGVKSAQYENYIYPTIELHNLTVITDGIGTYNDPYIIQ